MGAAYRTAAAPRHGRRVRRASACGACRSACRHRAAHLIPRAAPSQHVPATRNAPMAIERTFSIIKPDATRRNLTGKINAMFEEAGLRIVAQKRIWMTPRPGREAFYDVHAARPFFNDLVDFMISGPVVVQVLEGENAVAKNREIMGATNPANAAPGTIRKEFAESIEANSACTAPTAPRTRRSRSPTSSPAPRSSADTPSRRPGRHSESGPVRIPGGALSWPGPQRGGPPDGSAPDQEEQHQRDDDRGAVGPGARRQVKPLAPVPGALGQDVLRPSLRRIRSRLLFGHDRLPPARLMLAQRCRKRRAPRARGWRAPPGRPCRAGDHGRGPASSRTRPAASQASAAG